MQVDQFYVSLVYLWSELDKIILGSMLSSFVIASLRTHQQGKVDFIEATLCGIFCMVILLSLHFLAPILTGAMLGVGVHVEVPSEVTVGVAQLVAGVVGWYGTTRVVKYLEDKVGGSSDSN